MNESLAGYRCVGERLDRNRVGRWASSKQTGRCAIRWAGMISDVRKGSQADMRANQWVSMLVGGQSRVIGRWVDKHSVAGRRINRYQVNEWDIN